MGSTTIVHITCDFPDALVAGKTRAVKNLIDATPGYRHIVYSLNRVSGQSGVASVEFGEDRTAIAYGAPPYGVFLVRYLERVADWILADLKAKRIDVAGFHLHKLTVEGVIGLKLSRALARPFISNIWGDSDLRIAKARRDLTPLWKTLLAEASALIVYAPWTIDKFDDLLGLDRSKALVIPPIVFHDLCQAAPVVDTPRFMTLMHLDSHRRKNFATLVAALAALRAETPAISLDVYGGGSPKTLFEVRQIIQKAGAVSYIHLKGPLYAEQFNATFKQYAGFAMPTRRETFGMVFVEALFAGLPVLHSRGWGIDGCFDNDEIGYACDPVDLTDVANGLRHLIADQAALKAKISALQARGGMDAFKREAITAAYRDVLKRVFEVAET